MRIVSLTVGVVALAALAGCLPDRGLSPSGDGSRAEPDAIEIAAGGSSGVPGGPEVSERWVLRKDGVCTGTITSGRNTGTGPPQTITLEFRSAGAYRECAQLLRDTDFFRMRDRIPRMTFEPSTTWVEARDGDRRHRVRVVSPETRPEGFTRLTAFVDGLGQQARAATE